MVFFSKNKKTAMIRVKKLAKSDKQYKNKIPVLADKQIHHVAGWKTWKLKSKR
jgi:hypothetical protein